MASKSYGVSFVHENPRHQDILRRIESKRRPGHSRAQIIRDLCAIGLAAERPIEDARLRLDGTEEYETFVREAIAEKIERESDQGSNPEPVAPGSD